MPLEIERKFLVKGDFSKEIISKQEIQQGFLSSVPDRVVRVRISNDQAFMTVKGRSTVDGTSRYEWEKEIEKQDALELLSLCEPGIIHKTRYICKVGASLFEVDDFYGENQGLQIAEIELSDKDDEFEHPNWLGKEVTTDYRYTNASLSKHPYCQW
ncbi:MAG: CYTH domain-containing protein [Bacteroidales bacterium]|nr:CYTH domain-containing protein [Bacteroidales bacterium]